MSRRAVLYHRVSAADDGESVDVGLGRLEQRAAAEGWKVVERIGDVLDRPDLARRGWTRLRELVRGGEVDVVLVVALFRGPPGPTDLLYAWAEWLAAGVDLVSIDERIDTTQPPQRLAAELVVGWLRGYLRDRRAEQTEIGLIEAARKRRGGPPLRRFGPPLRVVDLGLLAKLYHQGLSWRAMAPKLGTPERPLSMGKLADSLAEARREGLVDEGRRAAALAERRRGGGR